MCNKDNPLGLKQPAGKSARKIRTRTRRPKFLSLRLELTPGNHSDHHPCSHLNLFPLHPAAAASTAAQHDDDHKDVPAPEPETVAARFFHSDGGATLAGLLTESSSPTTTSLTCAYEAAAAKGAQASGCCAVSLVRTAMRNKERDASEERWVRYSEVVEKRELEEVSSCSAGAGEERGRGPARRTSLKLDYDLIISAWRDRGPPYVEDAEGSRAVPDVNDELLPHDGGAAVWMDGCGDSLGSAGQDGFCTVPDIQKQSSSMEAMSVGKSGGDDPLGCCLKTAAQREASIQRYKEKRRTRLFSKRIRYHVRKLNAEKRPRMKGRFVKRI